jgi:hypothetical protein
VNAPGARVGIMARRHLALRFAFRDARAPGPGRPPPASWPCGRGSAAPTAPRPTRHDAAPCPRGRRIASKRKKQRAPTWRTNVEPQATELLS